MEGDDCEQDSGLESPPHSKSDSPERLSFTSGRTPETLKPPNLPSKNESDETEPLTSEVTMKLQFDPENYDDEPDETLAERLWGLTEMFPDRVVRTVSSVTSKTWSGVKNLYSFSRNALWIVTSTSVILFVPVLFELEIAKNEERLKSEQKQYLLGPSAAVMNPAGAPSPLPR